MSKQPKKSVKKTATTKGSTPKVAKGLYAGKTLVVVEAPGKVKKIQGFLGPDYVVKASVGHVMDLPQKALGVDVDNQYAPTYEVMPGKKDVVDEIKQIAKQVSTVILAGDEDREGEFICYSVAMQVKRPGLTIKRAKFNSITKAAVTHAVQNPTTLDKDLVRAQQGRRILDRLVGFKVSPLLWSSIRKGLSAGRVQSVGLRIIVDRQDEIDAFVPKDYWTIAADFTLSNGETFTAQVPEKYEDHNDVVAALKQIQKGTFKVTDIEAKKASKAGPAPFTTSAMQIQASTTLNWSAKRTNSAAQKLYEGGYCVVPSSLVQIGDGRILTAEQAVEEEVSHLFGKNKRLQSQKNSVTRWLSREAPAKLVRITTEKNLSTIVTLEHPMFALDSQHGVLEIPAGELKEGAYLACPDKIEIDGTLCTVGNLISKLSIEEQSSLLVLLTEECPIEWIREVLIEDNNLAQSTYYKHLRNRKITSDNFLKILEKHPKVSSFFMGIQLRSAQSDPMLLNYELAPEFWRWVGLVLGDGAINSFYVAITKPDINAKKFSEYCSFDRNYTQKNSRLLSGPACLLMKSLGYGSGRKADHLFIPEVIQQLPNQHLAAFIAGLWDSDGSIRPCNNASKAGCKLSYSSRSPRMIRQLRLLMLRFGIFSSLAESRQQDINRRNIEYAKRKGKNAKPIKANGDQHYLYVNTDGWEAFQSNIVPWLINRLDHAKEVAALVSSRKTIRDKRSAVPITEYIENLRIGKNKTKSEMGEIVSADYWNYIGAIRKGRSRQSFFNKEQVLKFGEAFEDSFLKNLGASNVSWERIKTIEVLDNTNKQYCSYVYDFSTSTENFICDGFFVHNCTYIRTDSTTIDPTAIVAIRSELQTQAGQKYLPATAPVFKNKANAQEAHEAIRPTNITISSLSGQVPSDEAKLYEMIYRRTMASQTTAAEFDRVVVKIENNGVPFVAKGQTLTFDGFLKYWIYGDTKEVTLPKLTVGQQLTNASTTDTKHTTKPPPRYNTGSIIKELEDTGVGRPSTYQAIIDTLLNRGYITLDGKAFVPTPIGKEVAEILKAHIDRVVDVAFTAEMEEKLDQVAQGKLDWIAAIDYFWKLFEADIAKANTALANKSAATNHVCLKCGAPLVRRISSGGPFYACTNVDPAKKKKNSKVVINNIPGKGFCGAIFQIGADEKPVERQEEVYSEPCQTCGAPMIKKGFKGVAFWGCSNYNLTGCKTTCSLTGEWKTPTAAVVVGKCDKCSTGNMIIKNSKRGKFVACDRFPKCKNAKSLKDLNIDENGQPLAT